MKKSQNLTKTKPRTLSIKLSNAEREESESARPNKESSIPKFNRKTENKPFSRKKSEATLDLDQPLCYISPKRTSRQSGKFFRSPKFQDVAQKFSAVLFQSSEERCSEDEKSTRLSSSAIYQADLTTNDQIVEDITIFKMEIGSLKKQVKKLEKENKQMKDKLNQLETLQAFLIQREAYIYQLTSENKNLIEKLAATEKTKENLEKQFLSFKEEIKEKSKAFDKDYQNLQSKNETQQAELNILLKKNAKLKEEMKILKSSETQGSFRYFSKENSENFNRKKQRALIKSKSSLLKTAPAETFCSKVDELNISDIDHKSANCDNETVVELAGILDEQEQKVKELSMSDECPFLFENIINRPSYFQKERDYNETIKKLKSKIRYSEIQIDILKKLKLDSDKIKEENNKLKTNNRKLLNRIDFISRETRKRNCNCDSSLELSLSPPKL